MFWLKIKFGKQENVQRKEQFSFTHLTRKEILIRKMSYSGKRKVFLHFICFHFIWPSYLWKRNAFCSCSQYCLGFPQQQLGSCLFPGHMTYSCFLSLARCQFENQRALGTLGSQSTAVHLGQEMGQRTNLMKLVQRMIARLVLY